MTEEIVKTRKAKALAPFVVGNWVLNEEAEHVKLVFEAYSKQPETPITDLTQMVTWVRANYGDVAGTFEFIRRCPNKLQIAVQTTMKAVLV